MWILGNNYWKKLAYLKPPNSVQRPRVSRYGLNTLLSIFRNSSGVLHDIVSGISRGLAPYAKYHTLTKVLFQLRQDIVNLRTLTFGRKCS